MLCSAASMTAAIDERITWLAPGPPPSPVAAWYQASQERRAFVARLLAQLLSVGTEALDPALLPAVCTALMVVESAPGSTAASMAEADGSTAVSAGQAEEPSAATMYMPDYARARAAAKALLAQHRDCLPLWNAYARLETAAKQHKAARRVYTAALTAAGTRSAGFAGAEAARLAVDAAEAELARGGQDARQRALHALTWLGAGGAFTPYEAMAQVLITSPPPVLTCIGAKRKTFALHDVMLPVHGFNGSFVLHPGRCSGC